MGLSKVWVAGIFLSATLVLYAVIGVYGRTADASEYYVAGRRIPAVYNGMATAADWMSAASFISMAGGLVLAGLLRNQAHRLVAWLMSWAGRAAFVWWPCWWHPTCGACGCTQFPTILRCALVAAGPA